MKKLSVLILSMLIATSFVGAVAAQPFVDDFENYELGDDAASVWEEVYSYEDGYSSGSANVIEDGSQVLEVERAYLWHNTLSRVFFSKVKVAQSGDEYDWYGSRLAFVEPNNNLERYEVRLYPGSDKIQVNYVDRTGRTGDQEQDALLTTSEVLDSATCDIDLGRWYYVLVMRNGRDRWKTMVFSWNRPTCEITWNDDRIQANKPAIGIQSAGKSVVTRFDEIFAI